VNASGTVSKFQRKSRHIFSLFLLFFFFSYCTTCSYLSPCIDGYVHVFSSVRFSHVYFFKKSLVLCHLVLSRSNPRQLAL
jgi:hypothetical protein